MVNRQIDLFAQTRLLAIVRGTQEAATHRAVEVLIEQGVTRLEVSLTSVAALAVLARASAAASPSVQIGAGTVLTATDAHNAAEAGAAFLVTPGICDGARAGVELGLPVLIGALTPSEVVAAVNMGATAVKLFPASFGGPAYLRALLAPFPDVAFIPVGGVGHREAMDFMAAGAVAVGVGSPLVGDAADGGDMEELRSRAREFVGMLGDGSPVPLTDR